MEWDAKYLEEMDPKAPSCLHFYEWERLSISYGHFLDPKKFLDLQKMEEMGIDLARRPTGGGITFHLWDFAFSLFVGAEDPAFSQEPLENYRRVNRAVLSVAEAFLQKECNLQQEEKGDSSAIAKNFCMAHFTKYDVVIQGKKVAGAAQRKTKRGFLHQGTIFLTPPDPILLKKILLPESQILSSMTSGMISLFDVENSSEWKKKLKLLLFQQLQKNLQS
jgi:lipoate-protein ligase A